MRFRNFVQSLVQSLWPWLTWRLIEGWRYVSWLIGLQPSIRFFYSPRFFFTRVFLAFYAKKVVA